MPLPLSTADPFLGRYSTLTLRRIFLFFFDLCTMIASAETPFSSAEQPDLWLIVGNNKTEQRISKRVSRKQNTSNFPKKQTVLTPWYAHDVMTVPTSSLFQMQTFISTYFSINFSKETGTLKIYSNRISCENTRHLLSLLLVLRNLFMKHSYQVQTKTTEKTV